MHISTFLSSAGMFEPYLGFSASSGLAYIKKDKVDAKIFMQITNHMVRLVNQTHEQQPHYMTWTLRIHMAANNKLDRITLIKYWNK